MTYNDLPRMGDLEHLTDEEAQLLYPKAFEPYASASNNKLVLAIDTNDTLWCLAFYGSSLSDICFANYWDTDINEWRTVIAKSVEEFCSS